MPPQEAGGDSCGLIPLRRLAKAAGIDVHVSALHRWASQGVLARDGSRVRLRTIRVGGRTYSTLADFERFVAEQNAEPGKAPSIPCVARDRRMAAVEAELDRLGV